MDISAAIVNEKIIIKIKNHGDRINEPTLNIIRKKIFEPGEEPEQALSIENIALSNIQRRIVSYYGNDYGIYIDAAKNKGVAVTISLGFELKTSKS